MSFESAKAFLERVKNDEDFRKSVGGIATAEERMEYVKDAGFDFTKDEIATLNEELSHDELEAIAAGQSADCPGDCGVDACENYEEWSWANTMLCHGASDPHM